MHAVSHAASGLPLVSFHASCIMHPEEEKGTWRRAQTGRRVGDADERSGKQRFQTGICRLFFLATKEIEIRDVKGKRDTQRKGCYPHAPDPHNRASKCHHFSPRRERPHGRYLISPLTPQLQLCKSCSSQTSSMHSSNPLTLFRYIHAKYSQALSIKDVCFPLWLARSITSQRTSRRSSPGFPSCPVAAGKYWVLHRRLLGCLTFLYCIF